MDRKQFNIEHYFNVREDGIYVYSKPKRINRKFLVDKGVLNFLRQPFNLLVKELKDETIQ